jgi:3D (Asp-Asp-Asp) domain-containing protein
VIRRHGPTAAGLLALALALLVDGAMAGPEAARVQAAQGCYSGPVTGYVRSDHSPWTYDGTSIYTAEPIAAAGWNIPLDSRVEVAGVGTFRVADRGHLSHGHVDIAVWTRAEALALTGTYRICVHPPQPQQEASCRVLTASSLLIAPEPCAPR